MRAVRLLGVAVLGIAALVVTTVVEAADWDSIVPGQSTFETVRARFGDPGTRRTQKIEGYDTTEWVYDGDRAPAGIRRLTVAFGILLPEGFKANVVRLFRLEPAPGVFSEQTVIKGWGVPTAVGREGEFPSLAYDDGLLVILEHDRRNVRQMIFTVPQKKK